MSSSNKSGKKNRFCSVTSTMGGKRLSTELGSIPNSTWTNGDLYPRRRWGVDAWKIAKRKYQG